MLNTLHYFTLSIEVNVYMTTLQSSTSSDACRYPVNSTPSQSNNKRKKVTKQQNCGESLVNSVLNLW